jgi:hypothetical protein
MLDSNSRIAVLLRGVSYQKSHFSRGSSPLFFFVNYDNCKDNIKNKIIDPLPNCDVYVSTYNSEKQDDIMSFYKPKNYSLASYNSGTQKTCMLRGLEMLLEEHNKQPYDAIVIIRFDVYFHKKITEMNIDPSKFNFCWREYENMWKDHRRTGDCFYVIGGKFIETFISTLNDQRFQCNDFHKIYDIVESYIGKDKIGFIENGFYDSNTDIMPNPIYHIDRIPS